MLLTVSITQALVSLCVLIVTFRTYPPGRELPSGPHQAAKPLVNSLKYKAP